jgi:hypothetical protein
LFYTIGGRVRKVNLATGVITTFAGGGNAQPADNVSATEANIRPSSIAFDGADNLYIGSADHWLWRVTDGHIKTIAGTGSDNSSGDGGPAINAGIYSPVDIAFDRAGNVYLAEGSSRNRVRKLTPVSH